MQVRMRLFSVCVYVTCGYLCANDFNKNVEKSEALDLPAVLCPLLWKLKPTIDLHELVIFSHNQTFIKWGRVQKSIVYEVNKGDKSEGHITYQTYQMFFIDSEENVKLIASVQLLWENIKRWKLTVEQYLSSKASAKNLCIIVRLPFSSYCWNLVWRREKFNLNHYLQLVWCSLQKLCLVWNTFSWYFH